MIRRAFDDPERCVLDRHPNRHLAFGHGRHLCLGANLARLELTIMIERFAELLPEFRLDPEPCTDVEAAWRRSRPVVAPPGGWGVVRARPSWLMRTQCCARQRVDMDIKQTFIAANSALTDLVLRVRPDHLALEVPAYAAFNDGQTLRTSLNLMAYENLCVPLVLAADAGLATNPEFTGDLLDNDLPGNYERLAAKANASVRDHADLDQIVHISYGDVPAASYLSDISLNRTMALYDAAGLTRLEPHLSEDAISSIHAIALEKGDSFGRWASSRPRSLSAATRPRRTGCSATSADSLAPAPCTRADRRSGAWAEPAICRRHDVMRRGRRAPAPRRIWAVAYRFRYSPGRSGSAASGTLITSVPGRATGHPSRATPRRRRTGRRCPRPRRCRGSRAA